MISHFPCRVISIVHIYNSLVKLLGTPFKTLQYLTCVFKKEEKGREKKGERRWGGEELKAQVKSNIFSG